MAESLKCQNVSEIYSAGNEAASKILKMEKQWNKDI